jgi:hypothetical protein
VSLPSDYVEDGGKLEVHSYPLEQAHIVYTSMSILPMAEGLKPHQLLMGTDGDVGVILNHATSLCKRIAQLPDPVR